MQEQKISVSQDLLKLIAEIDEFKGRWEALGKLPADRLRRLRGAATIASIGASTRIDGANLTDKQVEALLSNPAETAFWTRDEQDGAGYAETLDLVFQAYEDLGIAENQIRRLHQSLLRHRTKDERHRGEYKSNANPLVAPDEHGTDVGVVLETASPSDTPREMEELVRWANKAAAEASLHPLLIVAVFTVAFLAIHPFQDGNGRLSRVLTTLMLLRAGYSYVPYASLESVVEEHQELYYRALRRTQTTLKDGAPDWGPWLGFFLRCLRKQKAVLAATVEKEKAAGDGDAALPALSLKVAALLDKHGRLTAAEIVKYAKANPNTLKVRLRELVAAGRIRRYGKARATWYAL